MHLNSLAFNTPRLLPFRRGGQADDGRIQLPQLAPLFVPLELPIAETGVVRRGHHSSDRGQCSVEL